MISATEPCHRINRNGLSHGLTFHRKRDTITDWQLAARLAVRLEAVQIAARAIGAMPVKVVLAKACEGSPECRHYTTDEANRIARHCRGVA